MSPYTPEANILIDHIQAHDPTIEHKTARLLTAGGQFSAVLILDEALVFRFPRSSETAQEMAREIPLLQTLQVKLPLPIPNPQHIATHSETGELVFMGYPMLSGQPLLREVFANITDEAIIQTLAAELGHFLKTLHSIPLAAMPVKKADSDPRDEWRQLYKAFVDKLFPYMRSDAQQTVTQMFNEALSNSAIWDFEPLLCHGDFGTGNILYEAGHITGIIDFTFCGAGDPAQDMGALLSSYGSEFVARVCGVYPDLRAASPRVDFIRSTYALQQALYALREGKQADFDDGMRDYV